MSESWDKMRKAKEEEYFEKKNREALERLSEKKSTGVKKSPITGEPMEQIVVHGVVVDKCKSSGGVWLDAGELEQILKASKEDEEVENSEWVKSFFKTLMGK